MLLVHLEGEDRGSHLTRGQVVVVGGGHHLLLVACVLVGLLAQGLISEADLERCIKLNQSR